ncbi:MAG: right-handed parallel beta-helix repeat-containing protein [Armatimonadota bacterium]
MMSIRMLAVLMAVVLGSNWAAADQCFLTFDGPLYEGPQVQIRDDGEFIEVAGQRFSKSSVKTMSGLGPISGLDVYAHRERALRREQPTGAGAWLQLAQFCVAQDLAPEARACFEKVLTLDPDAEQAAAARSGIEGLAWDPAWWEADDEQFRLDADALEQAGTARFIAPGGDDAAGDGTREHPWASLQHAWRQAKPGHVLLLREGEYDWDRRVEFRGGGGEPGAPVTIAAYPGETVRLKSGLHFWRQAAHFRVIDLKVEAAIGLRDADFADVVRCEVFHAGAYHGIGTMGRCRRVRILDCHVHHNGRTGTNLDHGIYIGAGTNVLVRGNTIHDNAAYGIHVFSENWRGKGIVTRVVAEDNDVWGHGFRGGLIAANLVTDVVFRGNTVHDNGLGVAVVYSPGHVRVEDNDIADNDLGLRIGKLRETATIRANRLRDCDVFLRVEPECPTEQLALADNVYDRDHDEAFEWLGQAGDFAAFRSRSNKGQGSTVKSAAPAR